VLHEWVPTLPVCSLIHRGVAARDCGDDGPVRLSNGSKVTVVLGRAEDADVDAYVCVTRAARGPKSALPGSADGQPGEPVRIEVVGPRVAVHEDRSFQLARGYREVLRVADVWGARRIALPATLAVGGWPFDELTRIALGTLASTPTRVESIVVCCPTSAALERWAEALIKR